VNYKQNDEDKIRNLYNSFVKFYFNDVSYEELLNIISYINYDNKSKEILILDT
jgi:hypothetical protein